MSAAEVAEPKHRFRPSRERHVVKAPLTRLWPQSTVVLIANGPSLTLAQVATVRRAWGEGRCRVLGVNDAYRIAPWIDALYAADASWWEYHAKDARATNIPFMFCQDEITSEKWGLWWTPGPNRDRPTQPAGISTDPARIHYGDHSGFQALNIAVHLGASRILLLGYDCRRTPKTHWFGDHPPELQRDTHYENFAHHYGRAKPQLDELGIEVINCAKGSAIDCFRRAMVGDVLG